MTRWVRRHDALRRDTRYRAAPPDEQWFLEQLLELVDDEGIVWPEPGGDLVATLIGAVPAPECAWPAPTADAPGGPRGYFLAMLARTTARELTAVDEATGAVVVALPLRPLVPLAELLEERRGGEDRRKPSDSREARRLRKQQSRAEQRRRKAERAAQERADERGHAPGHAPPAGPVTPPADDVSRPAGHAPGSAPGSVFVFDEKTNKTSGNSPEPDTGEGPGDRAREGGAGGGHAPPDPGVTPPADDASRPPVTPARGSNGHAPHAAAAADPTQEVFDHWRRVMDQPDEMLTPDRRAAIQRALREWHHPVEKLLRAIDGAHADPFYMGQNSGHAPRNGITTIFGKPDTITTLAAKGAALAGRPGPARTQGAPPVAATGTDGAARGDPLDELVSRQRAGP